MVLNKKEKNNFILLFCITYMVSYITRINYGAVVAEIENTTGISKQLLSLPVTGGFITYGAGQLISGVLGDKISPKRLVFYAMCLIGIMNIVLPMTDNLFIMTLIWCINGLAQAFIWPPMVRLLVCFFSTDEYNKYVAKIAFGGSLGTVTVYLLSPLIISCISWKAIFPICGFLALIMMLLWNKYCYDIKITIEKTAVSTFKGNERIFSPAMFLIMLAIIFQGMLRDGVTTWMPSYISEIYGLRNVIAILSGAIFPLFGMLCFKLVSELYRIKINNPLVCAGIMFLIGTVVASFLIVFSGKSSVASITLTALLIGTMQGAHLMLVCMIPPFFSDSGKVSLISGVLSACTYVGSSLSTYGISVITEKYGWNKTILTWVIIATFGTAVCFLVGNKWNKKFTVQTSCKGGSK